MADVVRKGTFGTFHKVEIMTNNCASDAVVGKMKEKHRSLKWRTTKKWTTGRRKSTMTIETMRLDGLSEEEGKEFEEFHKSLGMVGSFTKQMVKLAIDQLRPEFERMAFTAAERAVDSKMAKVKEMQDELNKKEKELHQLKMEKRIVQSRLDKEKQQNAKSQQAANSLDQKEKEIRKLEADIGSLRSKLRQKHDELKKEREKATTEENKRLEIESNFQTEIGRLRKDLDKVKGHLGQIRSAKNVSDEETKKLRERERELIDEIEMLKAQKYSPRRRKMTR